MPLRFSEIRFVPTPVPTLAALGGFCLLLYLAHWQQGRAVEKRALQVEFDSRAAALPIALGAAIADPLAFRYYRARAQGEWLVSEQIFVDNKFDNETVGFHVFTPLKITATNRYLLVNRGWVARAAGYPAPPSIPVPPGLVTLEGTLVLPSTRFIELSAATVQGNVWQNLTVERYRKASGRDVLPLVLLADTAAAPLKPVAERPDARAEKHDEYMLTWYSLAATVVVLWLGLNVKFAHAVPPASTLSDGTEK